NEQSLQEIFVRFAETLLQRLLVFNPEINNYIDRTYSLSSMIKRRDFNYRPLTLAEVRANMVNGGLAKSQPQKRHNFMGVNLSLRLQNFFDASNPRIYAILTDVRQNLLP